MKISLPRDSAAAGPSDGAAHAVSPLGICGVIVVAIPPSHQFRERRFNMGLSDTYTQKVSNPSPAIPPPCSTVSLHTTPADASRPLPPCDALFLTTNQWTGSTLKTSDTSGIASEKTYDALGRL
uniref:Uncharacterized protein n=1 Tax=Solibacter usitatus (strain Ellin6076) TaxID=234267 RepID=Q02AH8_SOLUE